MRRRRQVDRGSSAIELAILAPVILLLIFSIIQFALWFYGRNIALQAAREGVSTLRVLDIDDPLFASAAELDRVETLVVRRARAVGRESLLDPTAQADYLDGEERVSVRVTGHVVSLVPGLSLTVSRTVSAEVERFESDTPVGG